MKPSVVERAFNLSALEADTGRSEFEATMVYKLSSRPGLLLQ